MHWKKFTLIVGGIVLIAVLVFFIGCQIQPTGPEISVPTDPNRLRDYESGSCTAGSFTVDFSGADFVTGLGWSTGTGRTISFSGSCSGCDWGPGVYGWFRNPLVEYYIGKGGRKSVGSYSCNGNSYTLYVDTRHHAPSIDGTQTFDQYNCSGSRSGPVDMDCHFNAWQNLGKPVGDHDYQVVAVESWSNGTGSASVSVSNSSWYTHWIGSGSATFTCGGSTSTTSTTTTTSGSTSTTTSGSTTTTSGGGTIDCSELPEWDSETIYVKGDQVRYNGKAYEANRRSVGMDPEVYSGPHMSWALLGTCM